jgi:hypothetical protein
MPRRCINGSTDHNAEWLLIASIRDNNAVHTEPPIARFANGARYSGGPVTAAVMLRDPSNLNGPCCSGAGIKIDFAEALGQNDKRCWALGSGLGLDRTPGGPRGEAHNKKKHPSCRSGVS